MIDKILKINEDLYFLNIEIERQIYIQFREDYKFWDSLITVEFMFAELTIDSIRIDICEFKGAEEGVFQLIGEGDESY